MRGDFNEEGELWVAHSIFLWECWWLLPSESALGRQSGVWLEDCQHLHLGDSLEAFSWAFQPLSLSVTVAQAWTQLVSWMQSQEESLKGLQVQAMPEGMCTVEQEHRPAWEPGRGGQEFKQLEGSKREDKGLGRRSANKVPPCKCGNLSVPYTHA